MEIERKWMVTGWPEGLPLEEEFTMRQMQMEKLVADTVGNNADAVGNIADAVGNIADGVGNTADTVGNQFH